MTDEALWINTRYYCDTNDEPDRAAFRTKLASQLHGLTGMKATLTQKSNDKGMKQWSVNMPVH
ncbi:hypothetical protein FOA52_012703 [Chlamydomonas sp. UWO 241]|nr:hypothetical protein FOA52_012703 [Chlamydomonas sp. UWO 241]